MTSVFKPACFMFWLTWLLCFSFLVGTQEFVTSHVIANDVMEKNRFMLHILCYVNVSMGLVGCCFLKCDIYNICCALLFLIPTALLLPGASIYGIVKLTTSNNPSSTQTLKVVQNYFKHHKRMPHWLTHTEADLKCCGIRGPEDYRDIYRSIDKKKCVKFVEDIPCTCCIETNPGKKKPRVIGKCVKSKNKRSHCKHNGSIDWMQSVAFKDENFTTGFISVDEKCSFPKKQKFYIQTKFTGLDNKTKFQINEKGCYKHLKLYYDRMKSCLLGFYIVIACTSFLMFVAYLKNCCKSSLITGVRSNYSLDVETLSQLEERVAQESSHPQK